MKDKLNSNEIKALAAIIEAFSHMFKDEQEMEG